MAEGKEEVEKALGFRGLTKSIDKIKEG